MSTERVAVAPRASDASTPIARAMPWLFVVIWATGFIAARLAMPHAPPFKFLSLRFALSALCFAAWLALAGVAWPRGRSQWTHLAVTGVLMHAGYLGGVWAAVRAGLGAGTSALIVGLQPVLTAIWVSLQTPSRHSASNAPKSAVSPQQWAGLVLGFTGIGLVVWRKLGAGEMTALNLALAVIALFSITAGTLYQKRFVAPTDVRSASAVQMLAALAVSLPFAAFEPAGFDWHPDLVVALAWSVLALTLGGSSLLYLLIQRGEATTVTSYLYLVPPCTAFFAWLLFGETLTALMMLGVVLTVAGVALVVRTHATVPPSARSRAWR